MARAEKKPAPTGIADALAAPGALEEGEKVENFAIDIESPAYKAVTDGSFYEKIRKQYDNEQERADANEEYWSIYNAKPDANQQYAGNSQCYVPAVRDCINARTKRRLKQLFPTKHKHVEAVGSDPVVPYPQLSLLEHYIRKTHLKEIVRSDLVAGDVTGQWNLYIDWTRSYRRITEAVKRNPILKTVEGEDVGLTDPAELEDATEETEILDEGPEIVDFADEDLAVIPPTCNDMEKADIVSLKLRMSKSKVQQLVEEGVFVLPEGEDVDQLWTKLEANSAPTGVSRKPPDKQRANDAGLKTEGTYKYLQVYEATARLPFSEEGEEKPVRRLAYIYFAGSDQILGIVKAPQWGGLRPVLSAPAERIRGAFKGISKIEPVKFLQWNLNDFWNMGQDSAMYSLLPITMTDPLSNPNYASMVIGLAAVWSVDPNKTKFASMPQLYKESLTICDNIKRQIWESMDTNEIMMGRMPQGRKNNQMMGQMQQEQMTNIMDDAERYEEAMLTPLVERLMQYDQQFRTESLTIVTKGEIGVKAKMQTIEPQQFGERYRFQWAGTSIVQGQQVQQMRVAFMNVLRGVPPQQLGGRRVDVTPILELAVESLFGPDVAPKILVDERDMFTIDPNTENLMMHNNLPVDVHEPDNDQAHIQAHIQAAQLTGDPSGKFRAHIAKHTMRMQAKAMQAAGGQTPAGIPGAPGAGPPGIPGTPRIGAQPAGPAGPAGPPGMPHPDQAGPGRG